METVHFWIGLLLQYCIPKTSVDVGVMSGPLKGITLRVEYDVNH